MKEYIYAESNGKGFYTVLTFGLQNNIYHVPCILDTGCVRSTLPMRLLDAESDVLRMKERDIAANVPYSFGYGVNDSEDARIRDKELVAAGRAIESKHIVFLHEISPFILDQHELDKQVVRISYDRTSPVLIGMDVLQQLDIHMGVNLEGLYILIACYKNNMNKAYRKALHHHFGLSYTW